LGGSKKTRKKAGGGGDLFPNEPRKVLSLRMGEPIKLGELLNTTKKREGPKPSPKRKGPFPSPKKERMEGFFGVFFSCFPCVRGGVVLGLSLGFFLFFLGEVIKNQEKETQ